MTGVASVLLLQNVLKEPLHPESSFRTRWDILLLLFLMYVCITAPVMVCFDVTLTADQPLWWFEIVVIVFFMLDVVLNFNTAFRGTSEQLWLYANVCLFYPTFVWHMANKLTSARGTLFVLQTTTRSSLGTDGALHTSTW